MDTRKLTDPDRRPRARYCPHCGHANPLTAYCCLRCFKVIGQAGKVPFWKIEIRPSVSILVLAVIIFFSSVVYVKHWINAIEARVNIELQTAEYAKSTAEAKWQNKEARAERSPYDVE